MGSDISLFSTRRRRLRGGDRVVMRKIRASKFHDDGRRQCSYFVINGFNGKDIRINLLYSSALNDRVVVALSFPFFLPNLLLSFHFQKFFVSSYFPLFESRLVERQYSNFSAEKLSHPTGYLSILLENWKDPFSLSLSRIKSVKSYNPYVYSRMETTAKKFTSRCLKTSISSPILVFFLARIIYRGT